MVDLVFFRRGWAVFGIVGLLLAAGCGNPQTVDDRDGPRFVTTIPPFEMILSPLVEGRGSVERLLEPGASPHTFDPAPSDLRATSEATVLVYGAPHLDGWAADLSARRRLGLVNLLPPDVRLTFGDSEVGGATGTVDPHFWTDPQTVGRLLPALADTLCAIDAQGCSTYQANADSFATVLATLDTRLREIVRPVRETPVFLAQPFFRYFLRRYGPRLAGIVEPRPGAEPSPRELHALIERARTSEAEFILTQTQLSDRPARSVAESATLPLVALDPLGGVEGRATLSELLLSNARILRDSLRRAK